ncbi:MAG: hypothetical protein KKC76_09755 [Proteobacteria bacterium]|nr:hypothetical protein [Pseudomonadota bacterium]MBU4296822.1 hypothetical protein [Pseudomonadota bacterium]MCG2748997.1 hypothetical protein [Desulfobulbaceae bacterium]
MKDRQWDYVEENFQRISQQLRDMFDRSYYLSLNIHTLANNKNVRKKNALQQEFMGVIIQYVRQGRGKKP